MAEPDPNLPSFALEPGHNCWRQVQASRATLLVDAAEYYDTLVDALESARHSILIVGWDMDSRVRLRRPDGGSGDGPGGDDREPDWRLGPVLDRCVGAHDDLHAHVLVWDFPMLYAMERESLPVVNLGWRRHRRVHFRMDSEHPVAASHHQKIVVIDDRVAFCGGIDLTRNRWDTSAHRADEPRRVAPNGEAYGPFHDVQMMVDGEAAACLGDLVRERWLRATGQALEPPPPSDVDSWPERVDPTLRDVRVGIVRTDPEFKGNPAMAHVRQFYEDAVAAARRSIYVENQYLTSATIVEALARRLEESEGPEVVLLINLNSTGWLEEATMDALRGRAVERLQQADQHGRLRILCPVVDGGGREVDLKVHAKVAIFDDAVLRVGSSNLNNRSMGLDTECDLAIVAENEDASAAIAGLRHRLLGEHLGVAPGRVAETEGEHGSLIAAIDALNTGPRGLRPLVEKAGKPSVVPPEPEWVDPERPVALDELIDTMLDEDEPEPTGFRWAWVLRGVGLLLVVGLLTALWRVTPLRDLLDGDMLLAWGQAIQASPWAPAWMALAYVVGGLIAFPITVLIGTTAAVFDAVPAAFYAVGGSLLSAMVTYAVGQTLGREPVRKLGGQRLNRLSQRLAERGFTSMVVVRILPVAPFTVINLAAGASHIRLRDFLLGTLIGMAPGILGVTLVVNQLKHLVLAPTPANVAILLGVAAVVIAAGIWLARRARGHRAARRLKSAEQDT